MHLTIAAVVSVVAALFESTVFPYLRIGGAMPHLVLVVAIVWVIAIGVEGGLVSAFVGGLALDVLLQRPLGASAFALLVGVGGAAIVASAMGRFRILAPVVATAIFSPVASVIFLSLYSALRPAVPLEDPVAALLPGVVYDVVLATIVGPLAVAMVIRARDVDRADW